MVWRSPAVQPLYQKGWDLMYHQCNDYDEFESSWCRRKRMVRNIKRDLAGISSLWTGQIRVTEFVNHLHQFGNCMFPMHHDVHPQSTWRSILKTVVSNCSLNVFLRTKWATFQALARNACMVLNPLMPAHTAFQIGHIGVLSFWALPHQFHFMYTN